MLAELILIITIVYYFKETIYLERFMDFYMLYTHIQFQVIVKDSCIRRGKLQRYYYIEKCIFSPIKTYVDDDPLKYNFIVATSRLLIGFFFLTFFLFFVLEPDALVCNLTIFCLAQFFIFSYDLDREVAPYTTPFFFKIFYITFSGPMIRNKVTRENARLAQQYYLSREHINKVDLEAGDELAFLFLYTLGKLAMPEDQWVYVICIFLMKELLLYRILEIYWPEEYERRYYYIDKYNIF